MEISFFVSKLEVNDVFDKERVFKYLLICLFSKYIFIERIFIEFLNTRHCSNCVHLKTYLLFLFNFQSKKRGHKEIA